MTVVRRGHRTFAGSLTLDLMAAHMEMDYVKAWGVFQYGEKQPVVSKQVMKGDLELVFPCS